METKDRRLRREFGCARTFLISFLDSSVLTFPVINDLLLIELSREHPSRMPLYALMAATGSTLGCILLYIIARKGGEAFFHSKAGKAWRRCPPLDREKWIWRNAGSGAIATADALQVFRICGGVFEMPLPSFASAIAVARLFRYFGIGYLAVRYGDGALPFLQRHKLNVALGAVVLVAVSYGLSQLILRAKHPYGDAAQKKPAD